MDGLRGIFRRLWVEDALAVFRDRIAQQLSWFSAFLLLPFTVNHLLLGRYALGCSILLAQIVFLINGHFLRQGRQTPVPMWIMVSAFGCAVVTAVIVQGVNSVFWAFPALFIGYFLMPRWQAQLFSLCLLVAVPSVALFIVGSEAAVRALASMVLTLVMINVVLGVIAGLQHALVHQAITDPLTGAWNRRHFETQLAQMQTPPDAGRTPNVLLALDIDHFKRVNDEHGHAVGDVVLQRLVQLVQLRKRDADQLFRTGGEEFVLLLPRTAVEDARCVAEDLRHRIECTELAPGLKVTVSIGVSAQATSQVATPWLAAADKALYEAKRSGRNRVVMASLPA